MRARLGVSPKVCYHKQNILVVNDEAHHAYRPAPLAEEVKAQLSADEISAPEEATVWVSGLDRIHALRGINFCADFSATPFHIKGSGYDEGESFSWIVSDSGLVDAIESGIVKRGRWPPWPRSGRRPSTNSSARGPLCRSS